MNQQKIFALILPTLVLYFTSNPIFARTFLQREFHCYVTGDHETMAMGKNELAGFELVVKENYYDNMPVKIWIESFPSPLNIPIANGDIKTYHRHNYEFPRPYLRVSPIGFLAILKSMEADVKKGAEGSNLKNSIIKLGFGPCNIDYSEFNSDKCIKDYYGTGPCKYMYNAGLSSCINEYYEENRCLKDFKGAKAMTTAFQIHWDEEIFGNESFHLNFECAGPISVNQAPSQHEPLENNLL